VATNLGNLARVYYTQGQYAKAEPLFQRALAILEKALGPEHPAVVTSLENYAFFPTKHGPVGRSSTVGNSCEGHSGQKRPD
jgi:hypothetical protein